MAATLAAAFRQQQEGEDEDVMVLRCFDSVKLAVPAPLAWQRSGLVVEAGERMVDVPGNVSGRVVAKVVAYWEARSAAAGSFDTGERMVDVPGNVSGRVVAKVVAYWEARSAAAGSFDDGEFVGGLRHDARVDLIHAAYHLRDEALFDLFRFGPRAN